MGFPLVFWESLRQFVRDFRLHERFFDLFGHGIDVGTDGVAHVTREMHADHPRSFNHQKIEVFRAFDLLAEGTRWG